METLISILKSRYSSIGILDAKGKLYRASSQPDPREESAYFFSSWQIAASYTLDAGKFCQYITKEPCKLI
jgi:hypothetical protein